MSWKKVRWRLTRIEWWENTGLSLMLREHASFPWEETTPAASHVTRKVNKNCEFVLSFNSCYLTLKCYLLTWKHGNTEKKDKDTKKRSSRKRKVSWFSNLHIPYFYAAHIWHISVSTCYLDLFLYMLYNSLYLATLLLGGLHFMSVWVWRGCDVMACNVCVKI